MKKEELIETPPSEAMQKARATKNPLRKLYFWTLHWADTKYALPALVLLSFTESSFFPIPPDVLLMAMCFAKPQKWALYAFWCTLASACGGLLGWFIGWGLYESVGRPIVVFYQAEGVMDAAKSLYDEWGAWAVLVAAITPIPYKIFTIVSGVFQFSPTLLFVLSLLGRGLRFFLVAGLIRVSGPAIKPFLEKNFELTMSIGLALGILGVVALKFLR
jgi:membrane protein YqaA with SNARE-associated domain